MTKLEICDNVGLLSEKLEDIGYLMQEIREKYFDKYDRKREKDALGIVWDYDRYASLCRILSNCIYEVTEQIKEMDTALSSQEKAVAA